VRRKTRIYTYFAALLALQFPLPAKVESCFLHLPISRADYGFEDIQRHLSLEDLQDDSRSGIQATPYWPASQLETMLGKLVGGALKSRRESKTNGGCSLVISVDGYKASLSARATRVLGSR